MEFRLIAATDSSFGLSLGGKLPWKNAADMKWFKDKTANNNVIMGRKTWESLGCKPLINRKNIILSKTLKDIPGCVVVSDFNAALEACDKTSGTYVIGGAEIYALALKHPLCYKIYITHIPGDYKCDVIFPQELVLKSYNKYGKINLDPLTPVYKYIRANNDECFYLMTCKSLLEYPVHKNRTAVDTRSMFGVHMRFSLLNNTLPLLTTKRVNYRAVYCELLWFLRGQTNISHLHKNKVHIWDDNATKEFLSSRGLDYPAGELGPIYGYQWRKWGGDQLGKVIDGIKRDPFGRRHIISAWNVPELDKMALPPCHCFFQFVVESDETGAAKFLSCMLHQRSGDMFLGVPFNIASYSILTHMIARLTGLTARELVINIADCHLYVNHEDAVRTQIGRTIRGFPTISFAGDQKNIDEFNEDSVIVTDYYPHPFISAKMAI